MKFAPPAPLGTALIFSSRGFEQERVPLKVALLKSSTVALFIFGRKNRKVAEMKSVEV